MVEENTTLSNDPSEDELVIESEQTTSVTNHVDNGHVKDEVDVDEKLKIEESEQRVICDDDDATVDYKLKYRNLKRKLKCLLYEQECFHEELRKFQQKCMRVNRDKCFLLDRLLQYEQPDISTDDENTSSSDEEMENIKKLSAAKNKKTTKTSKQTVDKHIKTNAIAGDKVRCRRIIDSGKQCSKVVSIKIKSGLCYAHRQQLTTQKQNQAKNNASKAKPKAEKPQPKQAGGGKDIGQIREAMEANAHIESSNSPGMYGDEDDELVIDLPH